MRHNPFTIQRQFEADIFSDGTGSSIQPQRRLTAKWSVGNDGNLTCQWVLQNRPFSNQK